MISITGISAIEIFAFGSVLGGVIEDELVRYLNQHKADWNVDGQYDDFLFVRQPETFPDLLLRRVGESGSFPNLKNGVVFGIELKSWYLLSKEKEPSFRFRTSPYACADADLMVVIPWTLSSVISGIPIVFEPYIESAQYVARYRNYWWQHIRRVKGGNSNIDSPSGITPYAYGARDNYSDHPQADSGHNFGRISRTGLMDSYNKTTLATPVLGIAAGSWVDFFKQHVS